jgi:hypothetical protein
MLNIFKEMEREQRINYVFRDSLGIGHRFPEVDAAISRCMQYETTIFDAETFHVQVIRDLNMNQIIKIAPIESPL